MYVLPRPQRGVRQVPPTPINPPADPLCFALGLLVGSLRALFFQSHFLIDFSSNLESFLVPFWVQKSIRIGPKPLRKHTRVPPRSRTRLCDVLDPSEPQKPMFYFSKPNVFENPHFLSQTAFRLKNESISVPKSTQNLFPKTIENVIKKRVTKMCRFLTSK